MLHELAANSAKQRSCQTSFRSMRAPRGFRRDRVGGKARDLSKRQEGAHELAALRLDQDHL